MVLPGISYGNGRVSIRGGYAINYLKSGSSSDCQDSCIGQPAVTQINLTGSNFPNPLNGQTTIPSAPNIFGEDIHNIQAAKIHSYSLSMQQEFGTNWWIEIAGAGVAGRNLPLELNVNQMQPYQGYDYNPQINVGGISAAYYAPYQGYATINYATSTGIANWNALETSIRHPVGHELTFRAQFTWSHGLSDVPSQQGYADENSGVQDSYNPMNDYGNTQLNQHLSFSSALIYHLPWFTQTGWTKRTFGGWEFSSVVAFLSGISLLCGSFHLESRHHHSPRHESCRSVAAIQRRSSHQPVRFGAPPLGTFFNTCPSSCPIPRIPPSTDCAPGATGDNFNGMFGNAPVGNILGPGTIINNVTLFKIFQLTEKLDLRFRAEAFNMVNHPNFSGPDVTLGDANFGAYKSALDPRQVEFAFELRW